MLVMRRPLAVFFTFALVAGMAPLLPPAVGLVELAAAAAIEPTGVIAYTVSGDAVNDGIDHGPFSYAEVWLVERDGTNRRKVDDGAALSWSPSGRWLLVGKGQRVGGVREYESYGLVAADGTKRELPLISCDQSAPLNLNIFYVAGIEWGPGDTLANAPCPADWTNPFGAPGPNQRAWWQLEWRTLDGIRIRSGSYIAPESGGPCGGPWRIEVHSIPDEPAVLVTEHTNSCHRAYVAPGVGSWDTRNGPLWPSSLEDFEYLIDDTFSALYPRSGGTPIPLNITREWPTTGVCRGQAGPFPDDIASGAEVLVGRGSIYAYQTDPFNTCPPPAGAGSGVVVWTNNGALPYLVATDPGPSRVAGSTTAVQCRAAACQTRLTARVVADGLDVLGDVAFTVSGSLAGTLAVGESITSRVAAGTGSLSLGAITGVSVTAIDCGGVGTANLAQRSVSFPIVSGDTILCTFTVKRDGGPPIDGDDDGDGILNGNDPCPTDATNTCNDPGGDGDGDGIPNGDDPCPTDAANTCNDPGGGGECAPATIEYAASFAGQVWYRAEMTVARCSDGDAVRITQSEAAAELEPNPVIGAFLKLSPLSTRVRPDGIDATVSPAPGGGYDVRASPRFEFCTTIPLAGTALRGLEKSVALLPGPLRRRAVRVAGKAADTASAVALKAIRFAARGAGKRSKFVRIALDQLQDRIKENNELVLRAIANGSASEIANAFELFDTGACVPAWQPDLWLRISPNGDVEDLTALGGSMFIVDRSRFLNPTV